MRKIILIGIMVVALSPLSADADVICSGCEYLDEAAGTYIGAYDPGSIDFSDLFHADIQADVGSDSPFSDFWVFDFLSDGDVKLQALDGLVDDFVIALWTDGGSECSTGFLPDACSSVVPDSLLFRRRVFDDRRFGSTIEPGRYILQISGFTLESNPSSYRVRIIAMPEPTTLGLLGLGFVGIGLLRRRRR